MNYNQYDVVIVNLNSTIGNEIQKTRPCLTISPKEMNYDNVIVAPMTSTDKDYPTRIKLEDNSFIVLDQIRTVSVKRITKIIDTKLTKKQITQVKQVIKIMLID